MVKIASDWLPTDENIEALPIPLRDYIRALEADRDKDGMLRANWMLRDQLDKLGARVQELHVKLGKIVGIAVEGEPEAG